MAFGASTSVVITGTPVVLTGDEFGAFEATASCPSNTYAVSGGGTTSDPSGNVVIESSNPSGGSSTTPATGWGVDFFVGNISTWPATTTLSAYVICGAVNTSVITGTPDVVTGDGYGAFEATASCPAGKYAVGGGGTTSDPSGNVVIESSSPSGGSSTSPATGWGVDFFLGNEYAWPPTTTLTAYVICG
jgi:hypothetical protein